ncbi:Antiseptic resistance protein [Aestuariimicrobium sp. T2.26MG-19.2B]|nr:Antiseptic resistance protein [Aestuariimicrobium sp. T2.26MG-19.2B]
MTTLTAPAPRRTYPTLRVAWIPMTALCLAFFVEMVDNTLLTIALPTIGRDLGAGTTTLQWVTGAYSLTFGGLLLTAGSVADRFGRRRVLNVGLAGFGLISLLVVFVDTASHLVVLRAALGIAAACMAPITNSLVFRLFDDEKVRMRAITVMIVVGMSGFTLGPLLGGTALMHVRWEWLLVVNAPLALIAAIGIHLGVPADDPSGLTRTPLDLPGAFLSVVAMGLAMYTLTSGVDNGWTDTITLSCAVGAVSAVAGFLWRERTAPAPMLDLSLFDSGTVRGSSVTQVASSAAMAGVMFGLIMHFQYALGWSPLEAGLANLPMVIAMIGGTPVSENLIKHFGHRVACLIGVGLLVIGLGGLAWGVGSRFGYPPIAAAMLIFSLGLRTLMTTCAVALMAAVPEDQTSLGAALNDTTQEVGTSLGTALTGTLIAALVTTALPGGVWPSALVDAFFRGERLTYTVLAVVVAVIGFLGARSLTDSRLADEQH